MPLPPWSAISRWSKRNTDTTPIINICGLLFEANEWDTGSRLYNKVKAQGDRSLVSSVSLSLAKYHFDRNHWNETIAIVETLRSDLAPEDYHHALLMHGISLQQQRKHRVALVPYAKIPPPPATTPPPGSTWRS
ncbi:MAG: hypothetical protein MZV65_16730 [Chromatiales bacterium]|nr:hypothetical protein [Chromatiales bacterium]